MSAEIPDTFTGRYDFELSQGRAAGRALRAGDDAGYERLARHLVAESATSPEDELAMSESMRATALLQRATIAAEAGNHVEHDRLLNEMAKTCPPRLIKQTLAAATLQVGLRTGYLSADQHDQLTTWIAELGVGEEIQSMAASIERR